MPEENYDSTPDFFAAAAADAANQREKASEAERAAQLADRDRERKVELSAAERAQAAAKATSERQRVSLDAKRLDDVKALHKRSLETDLARGERSTVLELVRVLESHDPDERSDDQVSALEGLKDIVRRGFQPPPRQART